MFQLREIKAISNSDVQLWKRCKRKFYLAHLLGLGLKDGEFPPTGPMWLGIVTHDALEASYGHGENPLTVIDEIYAYWMLQWSWDSEASAAIAKDHDLARLMMEGYLQWVEEEGIDEHIEIVATEHAVSVPTRVEGISLIGKLDVQVRNKVNNFRAFIDHKTVGSLTGPLETIEINEQFPTYGLLQRLTSIVEDEHVDGGYINMLKRVKRTVRASPPFYRREPVHINDHQLRSMWRRINAVLEEILIARRRLEEGADHRDVMYPTPMGDCSWSCPFLKVCPLMDDGSRWQDAVEGAYVQIDPHSRYSTPSLRVIARDALAEARKNDQEGGTAA